MATAYVPLPFTRKPLKSKSFNTFLQSNITHTEPFTALLLLLQSHTSFMVLLLWSVLHPSHCDPSNKEDLKRRSTSGIVNFDDNRIDEFGSSQKLLVGWFGLETEEALIGLVWVGFQWGGKRKWVLIFFSFLGWKHNWVLGAKRAEWYILSLLGDRKWVISDENWVKSEEWWFFNLDFLGPVCFVSSNSLFHILNTLTHISTHFFIHTYIKNTQNTLLKLSDQMGPKCFFDWILIQFPPFWL